MASILAYLHSFLGMFQSFTLMDYLQLALEVAAAVAWVCMVVCVIGWFMWRRRVRQSAAKRQLIKNRLI